MNKSIIWWVYVSYALSKSEAYNFKGNKEELMTLVGCIVSTSLEACRVTYFKASQVNSDYGFISYKIVNDHIHIIYK